MHKELMEMYESDGIVIGGTSAGAGMMPEAANLSRTAAFNHPEVTAFGIDEATAIVVSNGNEVEIIGEGSVMIAEVDASTIKKDKNGNYGCSGMIVRLLLDGDTYTIPQK